MGKVKWLTLILLLLTAIPAFANDLRTNISTFTWAQIMDTAGAAGGFIRNDTLYTDWMDVSNYKRLRIAVQRIPQPLYKDTTWASNVNDTTKFLIQHSFHPYNGLRSLVKMNNVGIRTVPVDSSFTNSAVYDTTTVWTAAQVNLFHRDSSAIIGNWVRGVVVVHDSTKTTVASIALRGNKYSRQFVFWISGYKN